MAVAAPPRVARPGLVLLVCAAAQALGVHRHTVRSRVALAERLLGRDLSGFHARADLWAALLAVD